ncbi:MAG: hypothetical protein AMXMBFR84_44860 [Candidatus Hydrogenedentota bacterium]
MLKCAILELSKKEIRLAVKAACEEIQHGRVLPLEIIGRPCFASCALIDVLAELDKPITD